MDQKIKSVISNWISDIKDYVRNILDEYVCGIDYVLAQLAEFFEIDPQQFECLHEDRYDTKGIEFYNLAYCYEKFIKDKCELIKITNYVESQPIELTPRTMQLKIDEDVMYPLIVVGDYLFRYKNEKMTLSVKPGYDKWYLFTIRSRNRDTLDKFINEFQKYAKENHYLKGKKFSAVSGEILDLKNYSWDDIILKEKIKEDIQFELKNILNNYEIFKKYGLDTKKGLIFKGQPGNGKTLLNKIIANNIDSTFMWVTPKDLDYLPKIFELARDLAPTILLFEDIDLYGQEREMQSESVLLGELMNELDGIVENEQLIILATTNRGDDLEQALKNRPGRFDRIYLISNPEKPERIKMLDHYISKVPNDIQEKSDDEYNQILNTLGDMTKNFSGAHIKELINTAFAKSIEHNPSDPKLTYDSLKKATNIVKYIEQKPVIGFSRT